MKFLGIPWSLWFAMTVNFSCAFLNGFLAARMRKRIHGFDDARTKWEATTKNIMEHAEAYEKLVGFAILLANLPEGVMLAPESLKEQARALIPPGVKYDVQMGFEQMSSADRVH